jgi:hypothetical protein
MRNGICYCLEPLIIKNILFKDWNMISQIIYFIFSAKRWNDVRTFGYRYFINVWLKLLYLVTFNDITIFWILILYSSRARKKFTAHVVIFDINLWQPMFCFHLVNYYQSISYELMIYNTDTTRNNCTQGSNFPVREPRLYSPTPLPQSSLSRNEALCGVLES